MVRPPNDMVGIAALFYLIDIPQIAPFPTYELAPLFFPGQSWRGEGRRAAVLRKKQLGLSKRLLQFKLEGAEPLLNHNEPIWCDGAIAGYFTSGNYGHHPGAAIGLVTSPATCRRKPTTCSARPTRSKGRASASRPWPA
ncbi:glycine cleavage T C-terminal barrel domain-containing protein [Pelagibius litoralis]|uniref:glycine cleavage T C-terminal barrel domain-containing protein n=1 Tax=Pelagibius litoralis TaxID=374515 RepID=UPI0019803D4F|nr:glycine cleavage T C-terminal barrel domain-containing protein [Pelagibius litoralis]